MDPASADHIPVMEYSSGVTVLLFWATNTSVKSCVTSACSMAPVASRAPDEHDRRQQPAVGCGPIREGELSAVPASPRAAPASLRRVTSPTTLTTIAGEAGHEGEPDPDRPEVGVEHQQTGPVVVTFTRFGYWAV